MGERSRGLKAAKLALFVVAACCAALPARSVAQVTGDTTRAPAPDTARIEIPAGALPRDTLPDRALADTLRADTVPADSLRPAPVFPRLPDRQGEGFAAGVWTWDREALLRFQGFSLLELLERVPGLLVVRAGGWGYPAGVSAFGANGGRFRVFLDGWELDPLTSAGFDLQRLALVDLEEVRVERGALETGVYLQPFRLPSRVARSRVEGMTGDLQSRILRVLFARPVRDAAALTVAGDIVDTDGRQGRQPFSSNTLLARANYLFSARRGVELEYRQNRIDRGRSDDPFALSANRSDLVARGRARIASGLWADAILAGSWETDPDSARPEPVSRQAALRAVLARSGFRAEAGGRFRFGRENAFATPVSELYLSASAAPVTAFTLDGGVRSATAAGVGGTELTGGVRAGPFGGLSAFVQAGSGSRPIGLPLDTVPRIPPLLTPDTTTPPTRFEEAAAFLASRDFLRAGGEITVRGATFGAAFLRSGSGDIAPFALPFESDTLLPITVAASGGVEGYATLPVFRLPLQLTGNYTRWNDPDRPYLPQNVGRASLVYHDSYYGGQLEPDLRFDLERRGSAFAPSIASDTAAGGIADRSDAYTLLNATLQLRIIDVRIFVQATNVLNQPLAANVPGFPYLPTRVIYGARWDFRN